MSEMLDAVRSATEGEIDRIHDRIRRTTACCLGTDPCYFDKDLADLARESRAIERAAIVKWLQGWAHGDDRICSLCAAADAVERGEHLK